jgi:endogenous inhibitor of DNA gyrase (YacG/DUF329 family)
MSHSRRPPSRPRPGPDWHVQDVRPYAYWREGIDTCATCGDDVDLRDDHFGMELFRRLPRSSKRGVERERFSFCSRHCVDEWLDD